jgi:acetyltransferase-like isoleucine patch superfamily enzyme
MYNHLRNIYYRLRFYCKLNWYKTLYFNFKMFPFAVAKKLPVYVYEWVKFTNLSGEIVIDAPIKRGMIGVGQQFEKLTRSRGVSEISIIGKLVIKGHVHIGKDVAIYVGDNAYCEFGHMACLGSNVKIICTESIILGTWARIGYESQLVDTNSHQMYDTLTNQQYSKTGKIRIGDFNSISNRVTFMPNSLTPEYCVVASNSLCNKDYSSLGSYILIGGIPAKLIKENFSRDWEGEKATLEKSLMVKW